MTTALKAIGCVGVVSNGPSRDIDEIRPMKVRYLLGGVTPGTHELCVEVYNPPANRNRARRLPAGLLGPVRLMR